MFDEWRKGILEALMLSQARPYIQEFVRDRYKDLFDGEYRIYIPLPKVDKPDPVRPLSSVEDAIQSLGYVTDDDMYARGLAAYGPKRMTIGKLIASVGKEDPELARQAQFAYEHDRRRDSAKASMKPSMAVISRHPYDIAGMSTGRGWSSCMSLVGVGAKKDSVMCDVRLGTLVAYLADEQDRDIKHPRARILIKPLVEKDTHEVYFQPEGKVYPNDARGQSIENFKKAVKDWCDMANNGKEGVFRLPDELYRDEIPDERAIFRETSAGDLVMRLGRDRVLGTMIENGNITIGMVGELVEAGADPHGSGEWAVQLAAREGLTSILTKLVDDYGCEVDTDNNLALRWAAEYGHRACAIVLAKHGANVQYALEDAEEDGRRGSADLLRTVMAETEAERREQ